MAECPRKRKRERERAERPAVRGGQWGSSPEEMRFSSRLKLPLKGRDLVAIPKTAWRNSSACCIYSQCSRQPRAFPAVLLILKRPPRHHARASGRAVKIDTEKSDTKKVDARVELAFWDSGSHVLATTPIHLMSSWGQPLSCEGRRPERERERGPKGQRLGEGNGVLRQTN